MSNYIIKKKCTDVTVWILDLPLFTLVILYYMLDVGTVIIRANRFIEINLNEWDLNFVCRMRKIYTSNWKVHVFVGSMQNCYRFNYKEFLNIKMNICEQCGYHLKMSRTNRIELLIIRVVQSLWMKTWSYWIMKIL